MLGEDLRTYAGLVRTRPLSVIVLAPRPEAVAVREAERSKTGYGAAWSVGMLDEELRTRTPRIGLWLDTSELTVGQTVEAILAERERARAL